MASASLHTPVPSRKRKPDPARVVQSYYHEVTQRGRRGAYRRTGDLYNISDETVRRFVHAAEERANTPPLPDELAYVAPPFADELAAIQAKSAAELATEAPRRDISNTSMPQLEPRLTPAERGDITSSSSSDVALVPHVENATRHTVELDERPRGDPEMPQSPTRQLWTVAPQSSDELDPQGDDVPLRSPGNEPGHARPDIDEPGAEAPELPPESFPNPEPNQPQPQGDPYDQPEERPARPEAIIVRQIVRVPEQRQVGGLVGWLSTNPMLGPVPVWALLLLGVFALLVQLGVLG